MIGRLVLFVAVSAVAIVGAERMRQAMLARRDARARRRAAGQPQARRVESATRCPTCDAWVVPGARCGCGG